MSSSSISFQCFGLFGLSKNIRTVFIANSSLFKQSVSVMNFSANTISSILSFLKLLLSHGCVSKLLKCVNLLIFISYQKTSNMLTQIKKCIIMGF